MPTSGYSRGETPTAEAEALAKKEKVPTTTTRQGLTPYQFLERFAQKFPRKGGSNEILADFSGNFVENSLDGHPHVHPLTKIATQSLVSTTSTTTTTTSTTTTSTTTTTTTTTTLTPTVSTPSLLEKLKSILEKAAYVSKKFNIAASKRQKQKEKKQERVEASEVEPNVESSVTEPIIWGRPKGDEDVFEERLGESFNEAEREEEWSRFQSDRVLHPENYVNFTNYDLPQKTHHIIDMGIIRFSNNASSDDSFGPSPIDPQPYHSFQYNDLAEPVPLPPKADEVPQPPSKVETATTNQRLYSDAQGRVATVHSVLPNVRTLKPTSPAPEFQPTPMYALVRKKVKPSPASNATEQIRKENQKEHDLRLGPPPPDKDEKSGGTIEQSQLVPRRKELKEETKKQIRTKAEKLTSDPSLKLVAQNSITDSFRPNVKETPLDFQPTLRPSQLSTEDPFLALFRPLGATFSPPASLQKPANINLLDWLASKSKLKKASEAATTPTPFPTSSSTVTTASRGENFYHESFDFFSEDQYEAGAFSENQYEGGWFSDQVNQYDAGEEIFEPEGQVLVVSMEDVDEDKVISSDIIYYDHEDAGIQQYAFNQDENELFSEDDLRDSRPDAISKRVGEESDMADQQTWQKENPRETEQHEDDMAVEESQNSFIVYPSNYIADFEEQKAEEVVEIDDFVTSPIDINPGIEVITPINEEFVTKEKIEDVMEKNNKIVDILKNTLQMQSAIFNKFFGYVG